MATKSKKGKGSASKQKISNTSKEFSIDDLKDDELEALEKEGSYAWRILKKSMIKELKEISPEKVMHQMALLMGLKDWESDWGTGAILDCYVLAFYWCAQQPLFDLRQVSAVFTLVDKIINMLKENQSLFEVTCFLADSFRGISHQPVPVNMEGVNNSVSVESDQQTQASPSPLECLSTAHAKIVSDFISETILQHYELYSFIFSETQKEELTTTEYSIQTLPLADMPFPCPLEEAVTEVVYNSHVLTPPPSPVPVDRVDSAAAAGALDEEAEEDKGKEYEGSVSQMSEVEPDTTEKEDEILSELTVDQIRSIVNRLAAQKIGAFQEDYHNKLKERESAYLQRITKLTKTVDV